MPQIATVKMLDAVIVTGAGAAHEVWGNRRTFQVFGSTSAGAGATSVKVEASQDNTNWLPLGLMNLVLGTSVVSDGFECAGSWRYVRGNVISISGTNAAVTLIVGNLPG